VTFVRKEPTVVKKPSGRLGRRGKRGQALVEYSAINFILIMLLCLSVSAPIFPGMHNKKNLIELFMDAYQIYYDSYYFVLNLPFP
jgi:hypothetical protein